MSLSRIWTRGMSGQISNVTCENELILDFSLANFWKIDVNRNFTLKNPINIIAGQSGIIILNMIGVWTITYDTFFKWEEGIKVDVINNSLNVLTFCTLDTNKIICSIIKDIK